MIKLARTRTIHLVFALIFAGSFAGMAARGETGDQLTGVTWSLVEIQSMDDNTYKPAATDAFTLRFNDDGSVAVKADCNRGKGSFEVEVPSRLVFGPLGTTKALCAEDSLEHRFLSNLEHVRSYIFRDGHLYLATMADGAILEFRPMEESPSTAQPAFDCDKAQGRVEETICSNPELAALDVRLSELYARALNSFPEGELKTLKAFQRGWIKGRNDCWKADDLLDCVRFEYRSRITTLQIKTGNTMVPSPVSFRCNDGTALTAYFYPDTEFPSAVLNRDTDQVIALKVRDDPGAHYEAANVAFREQDGTAQLTWFDRQSRCTIGK